MISWKLDGQRAPVALVEATGESLKEALELQQRLVKVRKGVEKALSSSQ